MKVSVVIPSYNRAYIIREAIESALDQTYGDFELIIVDDGSSDQTGDLVAQIRDARIRYIAHERNRGYSAACNTGIAAATGDLVAFLDSDDLWAPDYLQQQVALLTRHPEVDAVFTDTEVRGEGGIPSLMGAMKIFPKLLEAHPGAEEFVVSGRQMYLCLLEEVPIKPTAFIVKREVLGKAGGFDEAWPSGTDWDLFIRISRLACFGYIPKPLVVQRRTPDATHQKFREQDKVFLLKVFTEEQKTVSNDPEAAQALSRGIKGHCDNLAYHYLYTGRRGKALGVYLRGFSQTHDSSMLAKAVAALMPLKARQSMKQIFGKARTARV